METPITVTMTLGDVLLFGGGFLVALLLLSIARNLISGFTPTVWPMPQSYAAPEPRNEGMGCFSWLLLLGGLAVVFYLANV